MIQGFSIQFKGFKTMFISRSIKNNANHAIKLDSTNNRAYYVLGNNDYYTPEKFGGGKKVEEYIFKSLSLPTQKAPNPYLPSWGREEAYEILIRHYIYEKNAAEAKKYFKIASEEFPDNYQLKELATKLVSMD